MASYDVVISLPAAPALPESTRRLLGMFNPALRPAPPPPEPPSSAPRVESTYFRNRRLAKGAK